MAQPSDIKQETLTSCAPDLADKLQKWQEFLRVEKNMSRHTLRAYCGDVSHFVRFLADHKGKPPSLDDLSQISLRDFRSWMSRKAMAGRCSRTACTASAPMGLLDGMNKFLRATRELEKETGRQPTNEEIARRMDIPVEKVQKLKTISRDPVSLETPVGRDGESALGDLIGRLAQADPSATRDAAEDEGDAR